MSTRNPEHWALIVSDVKRRQQRQSNKRFWRRLTVATLIGIMALLGLGAGAYEIIEEIAWRRNG